jgi:4-amino-4-deoxy-L-arabinose transferase-like glycosyltransferase
MKNLEKLAIVLIVLWVLTLFQNSVLSVIMATLYGPHEVASDNWTLAMMAGVRSIVSVCVQIGVGIWLFVLARRKNATPWVWLLFGLCFGITAAILFFIIEVYEAVKSTPSFEQSENAT